MTSDMCDVHHCVRSRLFLLFALLRIALTFAPWFWQPCGLDIDLCSQLFTMPRDTPSVYMILKSYLNAAISASPRDFSTIRSITSYKGLNPLVAFDSRVFETSMLVYGLEGYDAFASETMSAAATLPVDPENTLPVECCFTHFPESISPHRFIETWSCYSPPHR